MGAAVGAVGVAGGAENVRMPRLPPEKPPPTRACASEETKTNPFTGYTPAIQALLAHQVTAAQADLATLQGQLQTGTLRALATTAAERVPVLPNVPTAIESGYKDVDAEFYVGAVAPAKTPRATMSQTIRWFSDAIRVPEIKAKFASLGFGPGGQCGGDFGAIIRKDYANYGHTIHEARLHMQ